MQRRFRRLMLGSAALVFAASAASATSMAANAAPSERVRISDTAFAGSSVNVIAGLQNSLVTHGEVQYAAFYAADATLVLAKRAVGSATWELKRAEHRGNVADAHNTVAIAVDGSGVLHAAWDHHGNPLNYARGKKPGSLELGPKEKMTGQRESRVTYPSFLRLPGGDLLFLFRDGASGQGNLALNRYSVQEGRWRPVHGNLIDGEGERNAYVSTAMDARGTLHLAWVWRETPDVATNHDLCYARSADGGVTWTTAGGAPLRVPMTLDGADYALRLPQGRSLMNPPSVAADEEGAPYLANYWTPADSDVPQYHIVHYENGDWKVRQVTQRTQPFSLSGTSTKRPPLSRSVLLARRDENARVNVCLVYRDDERGGRVIAQQGELGTAGRWTSSELTADSVGAWEPSMDPIAWRERGTLEMLLQRVEQKDGNDQSPAAVAATPIECLSWKP